MAYAPFGDLLPRSALVVHHGGIGTIALALAAGVPQVVRPMMGEQFDLGNRMQRLGVGRMITSEAITSSQLARAIDSLLKSERVSSACRRWQGRIDRDAGLTRAADSIESLAARAGTYSNVPSP
jgi:UDP:flavonoid glycosyltransferase YjiC (YdhE family)